MNEQALTWANAGCLVSVPAPALLMFRSWQLLSSFLLRWVTWHIIPSAVHVPGSHAVHWMSPPWAKDMLAGATVRFAHLLMDFQLLPSQERHEGAFICMSQVCPCIMWPCHAFLQSGITFGCKHKARINSLPNLRWKSNSQSLESITTFWKRERSKAKQIQTPPVNRKSKLTSLFNQRYFIRALGDHILCVSFAQSPAASSPKQSKNGGICHRKLSCCIICCSIFFWAKNGEKKKQSISIRAQNATYILRKHQQQSRTHWVLLVAYVIHF